MKQNRIFVTLFLSAILVTPGVDLRAQIIVNSNPYPNNPFGDLSYGTKTSPSATSLTLFDAHAVVSTFDVLYSSTSPTGYDPNVAFDTSNGHFNFGPGNAPTNLDSTVRFTAPTAGLYTVTLTFSDGTPGTATTDVHLVENGTSLFSGTITPGPTTATYSTPTPLTLAFGATLDFVVGNGGNGYGGDTTSLVATITEIPEPSTYALMLGGLAFLGLCVRRKTLRA
jgi:hypothetical protein